MTSSMHGHCLCGAVTFTATPIQMTMGVVAAQAFDDPGQFAFNSEIFIDENPGNYAFSNQTKKLTGAEFIAQFTQQS